MLVSLIWVQPVLVMEPKDSAIISGSFWAEVKFCFPPFVAPGREPNLTSLESGRSFWSANRDIRQAPGRNIFYKILEL